MKIDRVGCWEIRILKYGLDLIRRNGRKPDYNVYLPLGDGLNNPILLGRLTVIPKYVKKYLIKKGYLPKQLS